jgi:uncharacterized membrane protein
MCEPPHTFDSLWALFSLDSLVEHRYLPPLGAHMKHMKYAVIAFSFISLGLMFNNRALAELNICNESGLPMYIAVAWSEDNDWKSRGWFNMGAGECATMISGDLRSRYYWYYAESLEKKLIWSGAGKDHSGAFCVISDAFFFRDANRTDCDDREFRRIDTGDDVAYTLSLTETRRDPQEAAAACRDQIPIGRDVFIYCWIRSQASTKQLAIIDCWNRAKSYASFALCASKDDLDPSTYRIASCTSKYLNENQTVEFLRCLSRDNLSPEQAQFFDCATRLNYQFLSVPDCVMGGQLNDDQRRIYACIANNWGNYTDMASCAAGMALTPDQRRILACVTNNPRNYGQMAVCAVGNQLTPEQQVFASCAISTGMQPYAMAGCVGTQLTVNELQKCVDQGIGGDGCFGQNNTLVKTVSNAWNDLSRGPGPRNDLTGGQGFTGRTLENARHDLEQGFGSTNDAFGGQGFIGQTLESIRQNAPPPLELGTFNGNRVCFPWC